MSSIPLPDLVLYGRSGCHLCEEARSFITALFDERSDAGLAVPVLVERDIETDPDWHRAFVTTIPVVEFGGRRLELVTSPGKVRRLLAEVLGDATTPGEHESHEAPTAR